VPGKHFLFRVSWWSTHVLLARAMGSLSYSGGGKYSVRQDLKVFSGAVVPPAAAPEPQAILSLMKSAPAPSVVAHPAELSARDPETTDFRVGIPRFCLRENLRADAAFFSAPGIK
jgi:hypothetical protein